jgi:rsbT co-antagonist protein RsbR
VADLNHTKIGDSEANQYFADTAMEMGICGMTIDLDGTILSWNAGAERVFGYSSSEIIGRPYKTLFSNTEQHLPELELKIAAEKGRYEADGWRLGNREQRLFVNSIVKAIVENGSIKLFSKVVRDQTAWKLQQDKISQQQQELLELSTPVLQFRDRMSILPIIGSIDTHRARQLTENLLKTIRSTRAKVVVLDITGVPAVDSKVANHLMQTVEAARLMGAKAIVSGISPDVAQSLVALGVDLENIQTVGDLQGAVEEAERIAGYKIMKFDMDSGSKERIIDANSSA